MWTIKQIADELGLPKHKVKYQVEKLPCDCLDKSGQVVRITNEGKARLWDLLAENAGEKSGELSAESGEILQQLVDMLQVELTEKNSLLEAQSRQITELTAALTAAQQTAAAAQALHAGTIKHIADPVEKKRTFLDILLRRK